MLKHKKLLIVLFSVALFLTALTFYANKVLFPTLIKKIAIEQAKNFLKRDVTIESIRFNWVKGVIVDNVVIYQQDAPSKVFAQFDRLAMGIVFIPGFKEHTLNIPFVTIENPSINITRNSIDTWNFSDLLTPPPSNDKPSNIKVSLGGVNVVDGQIHLIDKTRSPIFEELFNHINLSMSLSYKGIAFDFSSDIPKKKGFLAAKGHYMPLNGSAQANVRLKNIDTASYLNLVSLKDISLTSGTIDNVNCDIEYSKDKINVKGELSLNKFDGKFENYQAAASITAKNLDIVYTNGPISAKGDINATGLQFSMPNLSVNAPQGLNIHANELTINPTNLVFDGAIKTKSIAVQQGEQHFSGELNFDGIKARKDTEGLQIVGSFLVNNLAATQPQQQTQINSLLIKPLTLTLTNAGVLDIQADIKADKAQATLPGQQLNANINLTDLKLTLTKEATMGLSTKAELDNINVKIDNVVTATGNLKSSKLMVKLADGQIKITTDSEITKGKAVLPENKIIEVSPQIELTAQGPVNDFAKATFEGSITFSDAKVSGFPYTPLDGIGLDADFKTDSATINAFTVNLLDTSLRASGTITDFKKPVLAINAEANDINLSQVKNYIPAVYEANGLSLDGLASLKLKFNGSLADYLAADIQALITLNNVNVASSKFNQNIKSISGIIEATPNSLVWREFKGTYLGKSYTLTGKLNDFKNPKITTSLDGEDVQLNADIVKTDDTVSINKLIGKYLTIAFDTTGTVKLPEGSQPILNLTNKSTFALEDIIKMLPEAQQKQLSSLKAEGKLSVNSTIKGVANDWQHWDVSATIDSPLVTILGYKINTLKVAGNQSDGKINNLTLDAVLYDGTTHIVSSIDLINKAMPFDIAINIDALDLKKLKLDTPSISAEEISGKFYLTSVANGLISDILNLKGKGSFAVREGYLADFKVFKGLLSILNEVLRLGQVVITDVDGNFTIEDQKITTDSLRLRSPTLVLLTTGWVGFDQMCDLKLGVDLSSGIVPPIAEDVLRSLEIRIYDKISNPKFSKKISVPQVINSIIKNIGIFQ